MSLINVDLSVIVPVRDKWQFTQTLPSVLNQQVTGTFEVVVVDYGSRQQDVLGELRGMNLEKSTATSVRFIKVNPLPKEFNRGRCINIGFRWGLGQYHFTLDADILIPPGYLQILIDRSKPNQCIRCIGIESTTKRYRRFCGSGIMLAPMDAIYMVGGYDETFSGYGEEDIDFHHRLLRAGYRVITMDKPPWIHMSHTDQERGQAQACHRITGELNLNKVKRDLNERRGMINPNEVRKIEWGSDIQVRNVELK